MENINEDFAIPYYIFEEIVEYVELTAQGHCKSMKWDNIKSLLKMAELNNRLTEKQVNYILETYNRE